MKLYFASLVYFAVGGLTCQDYSPDGYYENKSRVGGIPADMLDRPNGISQKMIENLHIYCVERINKYRSGELKFSNGTVDSVVSSGLEPLGHRRGSNKCSSEAALGDLVVNVAEGGGCAGSHANAFVCPWKSSVAQNSCCASGAGSWGSWDTSKYDTFEEVRERLDSCLQSMWDEGIEDGQKGHWETMRNSKYTHVSCGFAFSADGRLMMNQDFFADNDVIDESSPCEDSDTQPSSNPTVYPTVKPSAKPSVNPTVYPTVKPTINPTVYPTIDPDFPTAGYSQMPNARVYDYLSSNFKIGGSPSGDGWSVAQCANACSDESECKLFVYVPETGVCNLWVYNVAYYGIEENVKGYYAYHKDGDGPIPNTVLTMAASGYFQLPNTEVNKSLSHIKIGGSPVNDFLSLSQCVSLCSDNSVCNSFVYDKNIGKCDLYDEAVTKSGIEENVSGTYMYIKEDGVWPSAINNSNSTSSPTLKPTMGPTVEGASSSCKDASIFDAGYGPCSSYAKGKPNAAYCSDVDKTTQMSAFEMCAVSCGSCVVNGNIGSTMSGINCQDTKTFNAGYGECSTYAKGKSNHKYCSTDFDSKLNLYAKDACPLSCETCNDSFDVNTTGNNILCLNLKDFDAGYGDCSSYENGKDNHGYCSTDKDKISGVSAIEACSECGICFNLS